MAVSRLVIARGWIDLLEVQKVSKLQGTIKVAGDKSISHRAIMLSSISQGVSTIKGFLQGDDCNNTIACFRRLGVEIENKNDEIIVHGRGLHGLQKSDRTLDVGNSGTTIRLICGILAGQKFTTEITGDGSIRKRPMDRIIIPLREMGAKIEGKNGTTLAPLKIEPSDLNGIDYSLPVPSAQVKSAILLGGLYAIGNTIVRESIPSRNHTELMLQSFGANLSDKQGQITLAPSQLEAQDILVPGDISSAAFLMAAAAGIPGSHLIIRQVGLNPTRTGIIDVLRAMGGKIEMDNIINSGGEIIGDIIVEGKQLHGTNIGGDIIPRLIDEIPVLAVLAGVAEGTTRITGAQELKVKESNRITSMVTELNKIGISATELPDGMEIEGPNVIIGGEVESYGDHRIAMAMAIAGLFSEEPIRIRESECIAISFPDFMETLSSVAK